MKWDDDGFRGDLEAGQYDVPVRIDLPVRVRIVVDPGFLPEKQCAITCGEKQHPHPRVTTFAEKNANVAPRHPLP